MRLTTVSAISVVMLRQGNGMGVDRPRILVAEDNLVLADVLRFNLERGGFDVHVANSGTLAAEALRKGQFDAILTDYQMPGINGEDLCRLARSDSRHADVPVFLISAKCFELDVVLLMQELSLTKVFSKPFSPRDIVKAVRDAVIPAMAAD
ncbi:MAG: hypothetical protein B7Z55_00730 [Planctomycetales bacterium 12-60-4]|nr:MAG: hypothetical protein B7Z55_00730 [Planctomycetales bacterium 12-60-4]